MKPKPNITPSVFSRLKQINTSSQQKDIQTPVSTLLDYE